jgi:hypothetical protein
VRYPEEREAAVLAQLREHPEVCLVFPDHVYRRDGFILVHRDYLSRLLHRRLYQQLVGDVHAGQYLRRTCITERCQNPYHHEVIVPVDRRTGNPHPSVIWASKTHCPHGHPYTRKNTNRWRDAKGIWHRKCLECNRIRQRARYAREKGIA